MWCTRSYGQPASWYMGPYKLPAEHTPQPMSDAVIASPARVDVPATPKPCLPHVEDSINRLGRPQRPWRTSIHLNDYVTDFWHHTPLSRFITSCCQPCTKYFIQLYLHHVHCHDIHNYLYFLPSAFILIVIWLQEKKNVVTLGCYYGQVHVLYVNTHFTVCASRKGGGGWLFNWLAICVRAAQLRVFSGILGTVQGIFFLKFGLL